MKMSPEEKYREAFFSRVQKECRKHSINCSMVYDRIHIYTKHEDFYFTPDPNEITLMHRNAQKNSNGGYGYHVQGVWTNRTPESLVREVVRHTKYRYTEDGEYRAEKDIQAERTAKQTEQNKDDEMHENAVEKAEKKVKTSTKRWKIDRQEQIQGFRRELRELCEEHGLNYRDVNQLTYVDNGFEEFLIEFTTKDTKIQSKRCMSLHFKEAYNLTYQPDDLLPIEVVEFAESHFAIRNQEEYAELFCTALKNRCAQNDFDCRRQGNRIYVHATNGTYYLDAICGNPIRIYQDGMKSELVECPENAHVLHVAHCIEEHDKTVEPRESQMDRSRVTLIIVAASGWVTAGILLVHILCH